MKPVRRVFMSADAVGGVWTYALDMARGLSSHNVQLSLIILGPKPSRSQQLEAAAIPSLDLIISNAPLDWTARCSSELDDVASELRERAQACSADVAHLNAPAHSGETRWPIPLLVATHSCVATWWRSQHSTPLPADLKWRRDRTEQGLGLADATVVPSRSFGAMLQNEYKALQSVTTIYNGRTPIVEREDNRNLILTAGRLWDPAKNANLINTVALRTGLSIHAAGPTGGVTGEQALLPGLQLMGTLATPDLQRVYRSTKLFVSVPFYEPFGLSTLEAAQHGCALVLSDIPTLRELWNDAAVFVDPHDEAELSAALMQLNCDEDLVQIYAARAKQKSHRYTRNDMVLETLSAYSSAVTLHAARCEMLVT